MPELIALLGIFAVICFLVYYTTKFISVKSTHLMQSKYIKVLDRMAISRDKSIMLIKVGGECYLVAQSNQGISVINTVKPDELTENEPVKLNLADDKIIGKLLELKKYLFPRASFSAVPADDSAEASKHDTLEILMEKVNNRKRMHVEENNDKAGQTGIKKN